MLRLKFLLCIIVTAVIKSCIVAQESVATIMRFSEVIFFIAGAIVLICCLTSNGVAKAFEINYNKSNFTCGNVDCYGPFTTCNETETHDKPCCNDTTDEDPCGCKVGFVGDGCQFDVDECGPGHRPCGTTGLCHNTIGSFRCQCLRGWMGDHCNFETGDLKECIQGFKGPKCHDDIDECKYPFACGTHHRCVNGRGNFTCVCDYGWTGENCTTDIDECIASFNTCKNGATCQNQEGSYECTCPPEWTGKNCSQQNFCYLTPCVNNATCINEPTGKNCTCAVGWQGEYCNQDIDECSQQTPCMRFGNCTNSKGSFECHCPMGWQGKVCELDVDECSQNASLCMQGSTCSNIKGSFICHCSRGFEGLNCDIDVNECLSAPCLNNGTCNNTIGSFNCACAQNYTGTNCEKELSTNSGNGADNTSLIVGAVLGSVGAVGAAVSGVFLFKKFSLWRFNKTHREVSSECLNQGQKTEETTSMPGQTKFHAT